MKRVVTRIVAIVLATMAAIYPGLPVSAQAARAHSQKATAVLVHGTFAESASWTGVIDKLHDQGYPIVAAANPLRSLKGDADYLASVLRSINGPIVLVGHSYGGAVISNAATGNANVRSLVYVAAFAPLVGESAQALSGRFPGSTLVSALAAPVALPGGGNDLYIQQELVRTSSDVIETQVLVSPEEIDERFFREPDSEHRSGRSKGRNGIANWSSRREPGADRRLGCGRGQHLVSPSAREALDVVRVNDGDHCRRESERGASRRAALSLP